MTVIFVAGAVFGEVQQSLFVARTGFGEIWSDSRSANCCIFQYKMRVVSARSNLSCAAGCGLTGPWSDHGRIMLGSAAHWNHVSAVFGKFLWDFGVHFSWQVQYLVTLGSEPCCSAYCKWHFICDEDQSWELFLVAGAVFGDVGGWLLLLRAM